MSLISSLIKKGYSPEQQALIQQWYEEASVQLRPPDWVYSPATSVNKRIAAEVGQHIKELYSFVELLHEKNIETHQLMATQGDPGANEITQGINVGTLGLIIEPEIVTLVRIQFPDELANKAFKIEHDWTVVAFPDIAENIP